MPTARRRLSPEDRRAELLALGSEIFGTKPFDEVRIDEVAERAGVSRALMYHYFPDKRTFFAAVVKQEADRLYAATNSSPPAGITMFEEIRSGVLAYMAYHQQNPEAAWAAYVGLGRSDPVLLGIDDEAKNRQTDHIMSRIAEVVRGMADNRALQPDVERDLHTKRTGHASFVDRTGEAAAAIDAFCGRLDGAAAGDTAFTLILDDPSGNSFLENLVAPRHDPGLKVAYYRRTLEQAGWAVSDFLQPKCRHISPTSLEQHAGQGARDKRRCGMSEDSRCTRMRTALRNVDRHSRLHL
jgi:AcrR family transcriptional regulator